MPMDSVTQENVATIMREKEETETELAKLKATSLETIWLNELSVLESQYAIYKAKRELLQNVSSIVTKKIAPKKK
jgi:hypothetical protein